MLASGPCIMLRSAGPPALLQEQRLHEASQNNFVGCLQKLNECLFCLVLMMFFLPRAQMAPFS